MQWKLQYKCGEVLKFAPPLFLHSHIYADLGHFLCVYAANFPHFVSEGDSFLLRLLLSFSFLACEQLLKGIVYPLATSALSKYYFQKNVFGGDFVYSVIVTPVCLTVDAYVLRQAYWCCRWLMCMRCC